MNPVRGVIMIFLGIILTAYTLPSAITAIASAVTATWSTGAVALWGVLQIMGVVSGLILIIGPALSMLSD